MDSLVPALCTWGGINQLSKVARYNTELILSNPLSPNWWFKGNMKNTNFFLKEWYILERNSKQKYYLISVWPFEMSFRHFPLVIYMLIFLNQVKKMVLHSASNQAFSLPLYSQGQETDHQLSPWTLKTLGLKLSGSLFNLTWQKWLCFGSANIIVALEFVFNTHEIFWGKKYPVLVTQVGSFRSLCGNSRQLP